MRKAIYLFTAILLISGLILLGGCGSRKVNLKKIFKKEEVKTEQTEQIKVKEDSTAKKETQEDQKETTKTQTNSWKYTAPVLLRDSIRITDRYVSRPFWLILNGDSINVSSMPSGASLESRSESSEVVSWLRRRVDELTSLNKDLEQQKKKEIIVEIVEKEKIKEVDRQSVQWILVVGALLLGIFLPAIIKFVWTLALAQIPLLSKFKK